MTTRLRFAVSVAPRRRLVDLPALLAWSRAVSSRLRQRRRLAELSDHLLADIGISRADARAAAATPWWKLLR